MRSGRLESGFQDRLKKDIEEMLPGCLVMKMDPWQGFPDLLVLYEDTWFTLECKQSRTAKHRPNQDYYVNLMDKMSFSRFIYPENKEEVLDEIFQTFRSRRKARVSRR